jgi:hypothetical protein
MLEVRVTGTHETCKAQRPSVVFTRAVIVLCGVRCAATWCFQWKLRVQITHHSLDHSSFIRSDHTSDAHQHSGQLLSAVQVTASCSALPLGGEHASMMTTRYCNELRHCALHHPSHPMHPCGYSLLEGDGTQIAEAV